MTGQTDTPPVCEWRVLFVSNDRGNSLSRFHACQSLCAEARLLSIPRIPGFAGRVFRALEYRTSTLPLSWDLNRRMLAEARKFQPDLVWIEYAHEVFPSTLRAMKRETGATLVSAFSDDVFSKTYPTQRYTGHFRRALPLYDIAFTPRQVSREEFKAHGARQTEILWKGYNEESIQKQTVEPVCDTVFVSVLDESPRYEYMCALGEAGLKVHVHGGPRWQRRTWPASMGEVYQGHPAYGSEYAAALASGKVAINILSRIARDTQDSRAFEIPATGTMMLTERSQHLEACFREGVEADFFSSKEELVEKALHYVQNDDHRQAVARAGYERAAPAYGNYCRFRDMLSIVQRAR